METMNNQPVLRPTILEAVECYLYERYHVQCVEWHLYEPAIELIVSLKHKRWFRRRKILHIAVTLEEDQIVLYANNYGPVVLSPNSYSPVGRSHLGALTQQEEHQKLTKATVSNCSINDPTYTNQFSEIIDSHLQ